MSHTPGPWYYEPATGIDPASIETPTGQFVCEFLEQPSKADGLLMTAAPEMLALLEEAVNWVDDGDPRSDGVQKIIALITKAKG